MNISDTASENALFQFPLHGLDCASRKVCREANASSPRPIRQKLYLESCRQDGWTRPFIEELIKHPQARPANTGVKKRRKCEILPPSVSKVVSSTRSPSVEFNIPANTLWMMLLLVPGCTAQTQLFISLPHPLLSTDLSQVVIFLLW